MCVSGMMLDPPRRNRDHEDLTMTTTAKRWVCLAGKLMVVGEGATADEALMDARREARENGVDAEDVELAEYDPATHVVAMHGGIVTLVERIDGIEHEEV